MFKKIIAPVQAWLLSRGKCVGCGMPLKKGKIEDWKNGKKKVTCKCGRIFIYDPASDKYRRALLEEI